MEKKIEEPEQPIYEKKEEPEKVLTEEESQIAYTEKIEKEFFDEEDEITEVNWD